MRIITIGSATLDIILKSKDFEVREDDEFATHKAQYFSYGSKLEVDEADFYLGGGALNTGFSFSRMGLSAEAHVKIGDDFLGDTIRSLISSKKNEELTIKETKFSGRSEFSVILVSESGERTILTHHPKNSATWQLHELPHDVQQSCIYIASTGRMPHSDWGSYLHNMKQKENIIAINPSRQLLEQAADEGIAVLNLADIVCMNEEEGNILLRKNIPACDLIKELRTVIKYPFLVALTRGREGAYIAFQNEYFSVAPASIEKVVDVTGAGDAFGATLCASLLLDMQHVQNKNILDKKMVIHAAQKATARAAMVIGHLGSYSAEKEIFDEAKLQDIVVLPIEP